MPRTPQDVTEAELAVLQLLWNCGSRTVRQLTDELYAGGGNSENATVQKLLARLEAKDYVQRNRGLWPHVFTPAVDREELIGRRLQTTADQLCEGSLQPLLTHLVRSRRLTPTERESLRGLLDEIDKEATKKGR